MTATSLVAFLLAASLVVITPGLDTVLVLRTAASESARRALMAGVGVACGCLCWGVLVAVGLGAVLAAFELAYTVLRWAGAAYLFYLGARLIAAPRTSLLDPAMQARTSSAAREHEASWLLRGLLTNLLNPKVGVFYVSFLPQFIPAGSDVMASTVLLAAIHAMLGMLWFGAIVAATRPLAKLFAREGVIRWLDRVTGGLFVAFGLRLVMGRAN